MDRLKPIVFIFVGAFLLLVLVSSGFGERQSEKLPKMYIRKTDVDLGEFYEGVDIKSTFIVRNNGLGKLEIDVRPG